VTSSGLLVSGTLNVNSGASVTTGQVGTLPPSTSGTDFYSTTTALQIEASSLYINSGSVACNGDAVIGTIAAQQGFPDIGLVSVSGGGSLTTAGVAHLGVINPNGNSGPPLQGLAGTGTVIVSGSGSLWHAEQDIRAGDDTGGSGFIDIFSGATLQLDAGVNVRLGSAAGGSGYLTFDTNGGSSPTLTGGVGSSIIVGDQGFGGLTVQNGASITNNGTIDVGNAQDSDGTVTVSGGGSSLTCAGDLTAGDGGTGTVNLSSEGVLHTQGDMVIGLQSTATGTVTLTDPNTTLTIDGKLTVGDDGTAELNVSSYSTLHAAGDMIVASQSDGTGTVTVSDTGTTMTVDGSLTVGADGTGSVTVEDGAKLTVNGPSIILGKDASSHGTLTIDGADSSVVGGSTDAGAKLVVGQAGSGTLILNDGATFTMPAFTLGEQNDSSGTVKVDGSSNGQPSTFTTTGSTGGNNDGLVIGGDGQGELDITDGGVVVTPASATIVTGTASGTVTVDGADSMWELGSPGGAPGAPNNPGDLTMGNGTGQATLNVQNKAQVEIENFTAAAAAGSNCIVDVNTATLSTFITNLAFGSSGTFNGTVSGDGTMGSGQWNVSGQLIQGGGQLTIENGGVLSVTGARAFIGVNNAVADISNGEFTVNQLNVGYQGTGTLQVEQGGMVSVGTLMVGINSNESGTITVDGTVQPSGSPANLSFSGSAQIGESGTANLNIIGGGVVSSDNVLRFNIGGTGVVTVSGTGSSLSVPHQDIYTGTNGFLSVVSSGSVEAAGLYLSSFSNSTPNNSVLGSSSMQIGIDGLTVANTAPALLTIDSGGNVQVNGPVNIGTDGSDPGKINIGQGTLALTGPGAVITIGPNTLSSLNIGAGGTVSASSLAIGVLGAVNVTGSANSQAVLSISGMISVGAGSNSRTPAVLTLSTGASASTQTLAIGGFSSVDLTGGGTASIGTVLLPPASGSMTIGIGGTVKDFGSILGQVNIVGGTLGGGGTINGKVINGGSIVPGDPQTLTIAGDYEQTSDGLLDLEIDGADPGQYDQLDVTGNLELDSGAQLILDFANGFAPSTDDTFDIVSDSNVAPDVSFSQIAVQGLEPGWQYTLADVNGNQVVESLNNGVAIPEPSGLILALGICGALGLRRPRLGKVSLFA
jgi:T5SS/PEP-CTERM-associated repeat protein